MLRSRQENAEAVLHTFHQGSAACSLDRTRIRSEDIPAPKEVTFWWGAVRTMEQGQMMQVLGDLRAGNLVRSSGLLEKPVSRLASDGTRPELLGEW